MNVLLYVAVVLIWGSTWIAIKYQIGAVEPIASVAYRFGLTAMVLFAWAAFRGLELRFDRRALARMALMGVLLFAVNFAFVYESERYLTSGLVALIFALTLPANVVNSWIFLGKRPSPPVVLGGCVGIAGIVMVFWPDIVGFSLSAASGRGIALAFMGMLSFSLGQIVSSWNQRERYPVLQKSTAYAMAVGSLLCAGVAAIHGGLRFDAAPSYVLSLAYLVLFGSVIAYVAYLTLLGRIGADRAGYTSLLIPIVALFISTLFEGFVWTERAAIGVALIFAGNGIALVKPTMPRRTAPKCAVESVPCES